MQTININDRVHILNSNGNTRLIVNLTNDVDSPTIGVILTDRDLDRLSQKIADVQKQRQKQLSKVDYDGS